MKMKNKKLIFIPLIALALFLSFYINEQLSSASRIRIKTAYQAHPKASSILIYTKNFSANKKNIENTSFWKKVEKSNLFSDFIGNFSQEYDIFFFKIHFDLNYLFKSISKDFLIGKTNKSFFICSYLSYKNRMLFKLLKLLPSHKVLKTNYLRQDFFMVNKSGQKFYYSFFGRYLFLTNSESTMKDTIKTLISRKPKTPRLKRDEILISYHPSIKSKSLYFENFDAIQFIFNSKSKKNKISLYGDIVKSNRFLNDNLNALKLFPYKTPLFFYKNSKGPLDIVNQLKESYPSARKTIKNFKNEYKNLSLEGFFSKFQKNYLFIYQNLKNKSEDNENSIQPSFSFAFNLKSKKLNRTQLISELKSFLRYFSGFENFKTTINSQKNYIYLEDSHAVVSALLTKNLLLININYPQKELLSFLRGKKASFYDKVIDALPKSSKNSYIAFLQFSPMLKSLESPFKKYLLYSLNVSEKEYKESFEGIFNEVKTWGAAYLVLKNFYKNRYGGTTAFIREN